MEVKHNTLLEVSNLQVHFQTHYGNVHAVNGISFSVDQGEVLGVLGESGSGKSVSFQAMMGLVPTPPGIILGDYLRFNGKDILNACEHEMEKIRGSGMSMVFQDSLTSLNPGFSVGYQIAEMIRLRKKATKHEAFEQAIQLMEKVQIPSARERIKQYPHQFSGGMRQRVMIAVALALNPLLLIADEPTTALDVTVQRQIMELLADLKQEFNMTLVLITHDLALLAENADRVLVMYAGRVMETGSAVDVFTRPSHPYTIGLMESIPKMEKRSGRLEPIQGAPPILSNMPKGCPFHPRCTREKDICRQEIPALKGVTNSQASACHFSQEVFDGK